MGRFIDLSGAKIGNWKVIKRAPSRLVKNSGRYKTYWLCECMCGKVLEVDGGNLRNGTSRTCGCDRAERTRNLKMTHGLLRGNNGKQTKLYEIWCNMKSRCLRKSASSFKNYGGRGIKVCEEWHGYKPFHDWAMKNGYEEGLSIERVDNNGNYEPDNCKWIPKNQQARNQRKTVWIHYKGEKITISEFSELTGLNYGVINYRLRCGWSVEEIIKLAKKKRGTDYEKNTS